MLLVLLPIGVAPELRVGDVLGVQDRIRLSGFADENFESEYSPHSIPKVTPSLSKRC